MSFLIRRLEPSEAEAYVGMHRAICEEAEYMMYSVDDPCFSGGGPIGDLECVTAQLARRNGTILVATSARGELIGFISIVGGGFTRNRHRAEITMGVRSSVQRRGLGRSLLLAAEAWARGANICRLELSVVEANATAVSLYKNVGYEVEGRKRQAICINGRYLDGLYMAKLIEPSVVQRAPQASPT